MTDENKITFPKLFFQKHSTKIQPMKISNQRISTREGSLLFTTRTDNIQTKQNNTENFLEDFDFQFTNLENGTKTKYYLSRVLVIDYSILILNINGILLAIFWHSIKTFKMKEEYQDALLITIYISSIILCFNTFFRYYFQFQLKKIRNQISNKEKILKSIQFYQAIFENLINILVPNPFFKDFQYQTTSFFNNTSISHQINDILTILIFFRIIIICKILINLTIFMSQRSYRICKIYGCEFGYIFAIKSMMKLYPNTILTVSSLISIFFFAYALKIAEEPFLIHDNSQNFSFLTNSLWCVIITMTTIGYGDYYPKTTIGRTVIFFLGLWGTFIISLSIVTLTSLFEMNSSEKLVLNLIQRLKLRKSLSHQASLIITQSFHFIKKMKKFQVTKSDKMTFSILLRKRLNDFSRYRRLLNHQVEFSSLLDLVQNQYQFVKKDLECIENNQQFILENLGLNQIQKNHISDLYNGKVKNKEKQKFQKEEYLNIFNNNQLEQNGNGSKYVNK